MMILFKHDYSDIVFKKKEKNSCYYELFEVLQKPFNHFVKRKSGQNVNMLSVIVTLVNIFWPISKDKIAGRCKINHGISRRKADFEIKHSRLSTNQIKHYSL